MATRGQTTGWMLAAALCVAVGARQARSEEAAAARGVGAAAAEVDSPRLPRAQYVGGEACSGCHRSAYANWLGTKHARSHVLLDTADGRTIAAGMGVVGDLAATGSRCPDCHVTAADVAGVELRLPGFRAEEGVQCEACHGPGGGHVSADLKVGRSFVLSSRMQIPTREGCLRCHETEPSHVAALGTPPFDYDRLLERIRHPEGIGERLAALRRHPGAVMVRLLRRLLHPAYSL